MTWYRSPQERPAAPSHFLEPEDVCEVCQEVADVVVMHANGVQNFYCEYCIIIIASEWSWDDED